MRGYSNENPFEGMTQEEIEKQWNKVLIKNDTSRGGKTAAQDELNKKLEGINYTIRRKVIYKGKMAPKGYLYIVINFKNKDTKYEGYRLIKGGQIVDFEIDVGKDLRLQIKNKYKD